MPSGSSNQAQFQSDTAVSRLAMLVDGADPEPQVRGIAPELISKAMVGIVAAAAICLMLVNLRTFPVPWFDEGYFLAAAKMLGTQNLYAEPDAAGPWVMDPSITSGPPLILPIAAAFKLFGIGILQGRLVAVVLAVCALIAYTALVDRLAGRVVAVVAVGVLLAGNSELYTSFVYLGRQALGEVVAFGLMVLGIWLWVGRLRNPTSKLGWVPAGIAFGLSAVAKPQMILPIGLGIVGALLADRLSHRQASWAAFVVPALLLALCVVAWTLLQVAIVGYESYSAKSAAVATGVRTNIVGLDAVHARHALGTLWRSGFLIWGIPGLLFGAARTLQANRRGLENALPFGIAVGALFWFALLSIGWARYAFVPLALTTIWTAELLCFIVARAQGRARVLAILATLTLLLANGRVLLEGIFGPQDSSAAEFSDYLVSNVPHDSVIASWEWNLDVTAPQRFEHPPPSVMYEVIDLVNHDQEVPDRLYDPGMDHPGFLVDGPFSSWTGIFATFVSEHCERVIAVGPYTLYRVVS